MIRITSWIANFWPTLALVAVLVLGAGYMRHQWVNEGYAKRVGENAQQALRGTTAALQEQKENIADSQVRDAGLAIELAAANQTIVTLQGALAGHLRKQATKKPSPIPSGDAVAPTSPIYEAPAPLIAQCVVDDRTASLLNATRRARPDADSDAGASFFSDEEVNTPAFASPPVTGSELVLSDSEIARLYIDLAQRHDALVDWVNDKVLKKKRQD